MTTYTRTPAEVVAEALPPFEIDGSDYPDRVACAGRALTALAESPDVVERVARVMGEHDSFYVTEDGTECDCGEVLTEGVETYAVDAWRSNRAAAALAALAGGEGR